MAQRPRGSSHSHRARTRRSSSQGSHHYEPRDAAATVLHQVIREHLLTFLERTAEDGAPLPAFVERELRRFVTCGVLAHGFARFRCDDCHHERLIPFSCKGRGFCPSCGGRRMAERSLHLIDHVLPLGVPMRQWVLSLPHPLRQLFAFDHRLCRKALAIYARALTSFQRRRAAELHGTRFGSTHSGTVTAIQRFASGLRLNVHFHTLLPDGVFIEQDDGPAGPAHQVATGSESSAPSDASPLGLRFLQLPPPDDEHVAALVATIRRRILRMLVREGLLQLDEAGNPEAFDEHAAAATGALDDDPRNATLRALAAAAVRNVQAFGPQRGAPVLRMGSDPSAPWVHSCSSMQAHLGGFDLHAAVATHADDRAGLEQLTRYLLRPAVAQQRLSFGDDGNVLVELKSEWSDGTTHLSLSPLELLGRLASLVARPRTNLVIYHGVFAPNAKLRAEVVSHGRAKQPHRPCSPARPHCEAWGNGHGRCATTAATPLASRDVPCTRQSTCVHGHTEHEHRHEHAHQHPEESKRLFSWCIERHPANESLNAVPCVVTAKKRDPMRPARCKRKHHTWAELMRRVFNIDVLACDGCGGRLRLIATIESPPAIRSILSHLGLPTTAPPLAPARAPPLPFDDPWQAQGWVDDDLAAQEHHDEAWQ